MEFLKTLLGEAYKEGMTAEEISAELEKLKVGTEESHSTHYKGLISKANSEAADWKKKYQAKLTDEEKKELERKNAEDETNKKITELEEQNKQLARSISISEQTAKLIGLGYTQELASDTATAMVDGDMDKVLKNQASFVETVKQETVAGKLRNTGRPGAGAPSGAEEKPDYVKLAMEAQQKGEMSIAAYYTRLAEEASKQEDKSIE